MDIKTLLGKIDEYRAREERLRHRLDLATTDTERLEIERMLRICQVATMGYLSCAKEALRSANVHTCQESV